MKSEALIRDRLVTYKKNYNMIHNEQGKAKIAGIMDELKWVLKDNYER